MSLQWFLKYRPKTLEEVENQEDVKTKLKEWIENWISGKTPQKKAVLLYGPPGVGKSTIAEALAHDYKLELLEMNASDSRKLKDIREIAERAAVTMSLFGVRGKLIFLDEVDGINLREDIGAIDAILELIQNTKVPIIMAANDPWNPSLAPLRNAVEMIEVPKLGKYPLRRILKKICEKEKIRCEDEALDYIIETSEGDARYAINTLQGIAQGYGRVDLNTAKELARRKDRELDPFETLRDIFWAKYVWQAKNAVTSSQVDYEMLMRWISENIPLQYDNIEDIWRAYDALARASIFLTRSKLTGWDLLSYTFDLMGPGVAMAEVEKFRKDWKPKWKKMQFPQYIRLMSSTKENRELRDNILEKLGKELHTSQSKVLNDVLPLLVQYFIKNKEKVKKELGLNERETEYLESLATKFFGQQTEEKTEEAQKGTSTTSKRTYSRGSRSRYSRKR
ncbi:MAG: replication factor C large subunit [Sulfolobaceae archaeon]|nr:replication factor C large subunit [Sulfolobaceae archaeon]